MSAVTASPETTAGRRPSWLTGTLPRTTVSVGVLAAAVTTAGAVALRAAGVPLAVRRAEPAQLCPTPTVRPDDGRPHGDLLRPPAAFADTTASKIALAGLHLVAAASIVPVLAPHAD
jgi:hypothetical protein